MPTPSSLFASAIPISLLKLAGIKHPPPHPFSSHSFSTPLPHLHGVSRVHAILHSFTYPLKPLTQASISIQPIPILHATHNHVLPYPCVHPFNHTTKPVSLSKPSPTCGILPKKMSRDSLSLAHADGPSCDMRHSSFHLGKNSVQPTFNLLQISHIRNSVRSTFHLLRISHIRNSIRPTFHLLRIFHIRRLTQDRRGGRFNFPGQTYPDPLIALYGSLPGYASTPTRVIFCMHV